MQILCIFCHKREEGFRIGEMMAVCLYRGGRVSDTIGIDEFSFRSIKEIMMALVKDEVIAEILKYRKYKVWRRLDDNELLALKRKDGDIEYICVGEELGVELFKRGEMDSYYALRDMGESEDDPFCFGDDPLDSLTVEEKVRFHMTSFLHVDFGSKNEIDPAWATAIDRYKKRNGIRMYGRGNYFMVIKSIPRRIPRDVIDEEDQERVAAAFRLLNWLSLHPEKITHRYEEYLPLDVRPHAVLYTLLPDGSYERDIIEAPERKMFTFEPVPFEYEVLALQIRPFISKKEGVMECNLFMTDAPVMEEGFEADKKKEDLEEVQRHLIWPWVFMAGMPKDDQIFYMQAFQGIDMEVLRELAQQMIQSRYAPREIRVCNEWTYKMLEDFCKKTGIKLTLTREDLWVEDACEDFLLHSAPGPMDDDYDDEDDDYGDEDDDNDDDFKRLVSMMRGLENDEFMSVPLFIQNGLREAYDMLPEDLQKRCVKLWKWKV